VSWADETTAHLEYIEVADGVPVRRPASRLATEPSGQDTGPRLTEEPLAEPWATEWDGRDWDWPFTSADHDAATLRASDASCAT
jgi:hypothetical protein